MPKAVNARLGFMLPDEQALPAEIEMPAESNRTSWAAALSPGMVQACIDDKRMPPVGWYTPPASVIGYSRSNIGYARSCSHFTIGKASLGPPGKRPILNCSTAVANPTAAGTF